ncbi:MAG: LPXTG cell wall anchor domain-containing protein [Limosilactobacillus sp.]|uniref:LPXTG cell wall anchor domain-containing protein n=1 Tax=Limosilactobacillus sp. TaxID=2773925 RepID=UPI0026F5509E|nr:LPXTG cell wall anchor domain-containing protein [Limosilactobacillus sp.]
MKKQPTYKLRKLTIGVCSVALMSIFATQMHATTVHADTDTETTATTATTTANSDDNTATLTPSATDEQNATDDTKDAADATKTAQDTSATDQDTNAQATKATDAETSTQATPAATATAPTVPTTVLAEEASNEATDFTVEDFDYAVSYNGNVDNTAGKGSQVATGVKPESISKITGKVVTLDERVKNITPDALATLVNNASELYIKNPVTLVNRWGDKRNIGRLLDGNTNLTKADFSGLELTTAQATYAFSGATNLTSIVLPKLYPGTTQIYNMLSDDPKLTSVTIPESWKSFDIQDISGLFKNDTALTSVDLTNLNLSAVTKAKNAFEASGLTGKVVVPTFAQGADVSGLYQNAKGITSVDATSLNGGTTTSFLRGASNVQTVTLGANYTDGTEALNTGNRDMVVIVPEGYDTTTLTSYTKALSSNYQILGIRGDDGILSHTYTTIQPKQVFTQAEYDALTKDSVNNDIDANAMLSDAAKQTLKDQVAKTTDKVELDRLDQVAKYDKTKINNLSISTIQYKGEDVLDFVANTVIDDQTTLTIKKATYVPGTGFVTYGTDRTVDVTVPGGLVWDATSNSYKHSDTYDDDFNTAATALGITPTTNYTFDETQVEQPNVQNRVTTTAPAVQDEYDTPTLIEYSEQDPVDLKNFDTTLSSFNGMQESTITEKIQELQAQNPNVTFNVTDNSDGTKSVNYVWKLDDTNTVTSDAIKITPAKPFTVKGDQVLTEDQAAKLTAEDLVDEKGDFGNFTFDFDPAKTGEEQTVTVTGKDSNDADVPLTATVKVTVLKNFTAADKSVAQGTTLDPATDLVTDKGGYTNFTIEGYDATKPGVQTVTVKGDDGQGHEYSTTVQVTVTAKDFTLVDGKTVKPGTQLTGDDLVADAGDYKDFIVSGYDANKPGQQTVTVTGTDNSGNKVEKTVTVTVEANEFTVVPTKTVNQGTDLKGADLVENAGDYTNFTITGYDANKPGQQTVTVTGEDAAGNKVSKDVTVTVHAKDFTLVDGKTVAQGTELNPTDLVKDAGDYKDFTVSGYDANKPGTQTVKVTGTDNSGYKVAHEVTVTVEAKNFTVVDAKTVTEGTDLTADDLLTDKGDYTNFTVSGYDAKTPGVQTVTVTATDASGKTATKTVKVTVLKDFTVVDGLTVAQGTPVVVENLVTDKGDYTNFTMEGFNPAQPGEQEVTVKGDDGQGHVVTKTVKVTVLKDFTAEGKTVTEDDELTADDLVTDKGDYTEFTLQGYDATKTGEQQVTIVATDGQGHTLTKTVTVTVEAKEVPAQPVTPAQPAQPAAPAEVTEEAVKAETPAAKAQPEAKKLPQTGNESAIAGLALGSFVGMLGLGLAGKKRNN